MIKKITIVFLLASLAPIMVLSQETHSSLYYSLGDAMKENNCKEAIKNFKLSIKFNEPKIKEATIEICLCYKFIDNYKESINWGEKALHYKLTDLEKYQVYETMALSYGYLADDDNASKYFELIKQFVSSYEIPGQWVFVKDGWYRITESIYDVIYYNKNTVKKNGKSKINVWLKWHWDGKSMMEEDWVKVYNNGNDTEAINQRINEIMAERENVSYTLQYLECDFIKNRTRLLEAIKYDKKGNVLEHMSTENSRSYKVYSDWQIIVPGSVGETIYDYLKKKYLR